MDISHRMAWSLTLFTLFSMEQTLMLKECDLAWVSFHSYGGLSLNLLFSGSIDSSDLGI